MAPVSADSGTAASAQRGSRRLSSEVAAVAATVGNSHGETPRANRTRPGRWLTESWDTGNLL
ncbi:hypothetical protein GCM10010156_15080 [Planobispora rosea]|uniref:Uncharacterized protein n=1 Tax=Planobispora rosea TaxID=35762 RepID=A0A8J3S012_PLARO|nr:hypothetical protein GCM10010156_15080 [Planobispora rosea]GIH83421.1 hypothetical protein Pro02_18290 [Planobispora rosea]